MAISIVYNMINVNTLDTNATISIGENVQTKWDSHNKNTFGTGMYFGICHSFNFFNVVNDQDVIDMPVNDQDTVPMPVVNQSL